MKHRYPKRLYRRSLLGLGVIAVLTWAFAAISLFMLTIPSVMNKQILDPDSDLWSPNHEDASLFVKKDSRGSYSLNENYQNPKILAHGCSVTILYVDPRISKAAAGSDVWYSLESMAVNVGMYSVFYLVILTTLSFLVK